MSQAEGDAVRLSSRRMLRGVASANECVLGSSRRELAFLGSCFFQFHSEDVAVFVYSAPAGIRLGSLKGSGLVADKAGCGVHTVLTL